MEVMEMLMEKLRDSLESSTYGFKRNNFILNWYAKRELIDFIDSTSNDPHEIDYHPFSIHDGITELPQILLERFDDFPLLFNAFVESYSFNSLNPDERSYYSLFFVSKRELEGSEYIRLSLNNALFNDDLEDMDGFEEQYFPNACAGEIEEFSAILPVCDVVNNSIVAEGGYYFVLKLRG